MKKKLFAAVLALVGCATLSAQAATNSTDETYVLQAYRANLLEIREARFVLRQSTYPRLRDFAQTVIEDDSLANVRLRSAARVAGVQFPDLVATERTISLMTDTEVDGTSTTTVTTTIVSDANPYGPAAPSAIALRTALAADGWRALNGLSGPDMAHQYWQNATIEDKQMLDLLNDEMANGSDTTLRALADKQAVVVKRHFDLALQHLDGTYSPK
jgi:predicted outer membrane protein